MAEQEEYKIYCVFGQDQERFITITVEENLDREGEEDKANFDIGGGTGDLFVLQSEQCSNSLGD